MVETILLVFAFVLALLESLWPWYRGPGPSRPHLGWLSLALYFLALILGRNLGTLMH